MNNKLCLIISTGHALDFSIDIVRLLA